MSRGTIAQKERWALDLLTLDKIGAWAITEPGSGLGRVRLHEGDRAPRRRRLRAERHKTFITNGPYADTIVFICKLDEGNPTERAQGRCTFVLDRGMPGLTQSKPLRKMGLHSSPTGELFLEDVRVGKDRLLGETEDVADARPRRRQGDLHHRAHRRRGDGARHRRAVPRRCASTTPTTRVQFGRPIGEFQLIQRKLAKMEVARMNIQNIVFRQIETSGADQALTLAEASACKLYAAQAAMEVALEAVQLFGGNGYMAEYQRRAALPRRQGAADLRRHRRDPDLADRERLVALQIRPIMSWRRARMAGCRRGRR